METAVICIDTPIDGAILNRHDGHECDGQLRVMLKGHYDGSEPVFVNGVEAGLGRGAFQAEIDLRDRRTTLTAQAGNETCSIDVLYDRGSFKRYRFSLDDDIWFLRDIATERPASVFDNRYMALWRRLHERYGTKINCNIYFQCDDFNLTMMPDVYRSEWADNADWFRLTFHALQNDPKEPYIEAGYDDVARDYDLIANEILRFAGEDVMNEFTTIHWGEATREGCRAVRDRGIRGLCGYFMVRDDIPKVSYYLDRERTDYLSTHDYWLDTSEDLIFIRHDIVANTVRCEDIRAHLDRTAANPQQRDVMEFMIHEQYFYPEYRAHLADYAERCETTVQWASDNGYAPVFWSDGFLGVPGISELPVYGRQSGCRQGLVGA